MKPLLVSLFLMLALAGNAVAQQQVEVISVVEMLSVGKIVVYSPNGIQREVPIDKVNPLDLSSASTMQTKLEKNEKIRLALFAELLAEGWRLTSTEYVYSNARYTFVREPR